MYVLAVPNRLVAKMQRQYWRGYGHALDHVGAVLHGITRHPLSPDQERLAHALSRAVNEMAPDEGLLVEQPTNADLAAKYAISPRTVTNWRRNGCPFDDGQWRVLDWGAEQRLLPGPFKARFARQLQKRWEKEAWRETREALSAGVSELEEMVTRARNAGFL
jgi:hypothetical protein